MRAIPLLAKKFRLYALIRNAGYCARLTKLGVTPVMGDLDDRRSLARIAGLADAVLHFAPPAAGGVVDLRTRNLLAVLSGSGRKLPEKLVYISTSGVYGDCRGELVSETRPVRPATARGRLRVDAESQIRRWAKRNGVDASILRVPGIYAAERLPLERIRSGAPAIVEAEDSYSNHIHADDLAEIAVAALRRGKPCRIYHASDDDQMKMGEYFDAVARAFGLPLAARLSRLEVQCSVSPVMWSFMNESRRLINLRMKRELKVVLRYPTLSAFLAGNIQGQLR